jgi:hypothetical protein
MFLLKHEFLSVVTRPLLWIGTLAFCVFLVHLVGHLAIGEEPVTVALYQTPGDSSEMTKWLQQARGLLIQMAGVSIVPPGDEVTSDIANRMVRDQADIAITQTIDGWRFTIKSRSLLEHTQFVRVAQQLGASLSKEKPWAIFVYESLQKRTEGESQSGDWPAKVQIAGITADPGRHARLFIPKTIALLAYFVCFAFACRGMIRDISNNMLPVIVVASRGRWSHLVAAKVLVSVLMGLVTLWLLLGFAALTENFEIKDGVYVSTVIQLIALLVSAMLGVAFSLLCRTEARIYFIGSAYLVLLVLVSGLIARIDPKDKILSWISDLFPLGYAMDSLSTWMFFGLVPAISDAPIHIMLAFLILSTIFVSASVFQFKISI